MTWSVLLEQCNHVRVISWSNRQAASVLTNNPIMPSHYISPQTLPTEAALRGTKKFLNCFPWICHKHLLPCEQISPAYPEKSQSRILRICKKHHIQQPLQYYGSWRLDPVCIMVMGSKFQETILISVVPVRFMSDCIKWWLLVVWGLIFRRILFKVPLPKSNWEIRCPRWKHPLILGSIGIDYY